MDELSLRSRQEPGVVRFENFEELKTYLSGVLTQYENLAYTEDMLKDAKKDKKELSRLRKDLDDRRKEIKKNYLLPYNSFELQVKELLDMIDIPLGKIKDFVEVMEERDKGAKLADIETYFTEHSSALGPVSKDIYHSPAFFEHKWLNKSMSARTWMDEVDEKIAKAAKDLQSIYAAGGQYTEAMITKYMETLSMDGMAEYRDHLVSLNSVESDEPEPIAATDQRMGYKILKLSGTADQIAQAAEFLALSGLEIEELEDGMPLPMRELYCPNFDSFVAFDLETSGTYGAANGDGPAEITEIGAVRVERGQIVDRFSTLVNPGRKIVPRIARITHITDDMVADAPDINAALKEFSTFIGDDILVGHNIKASDLNYIDSAARRVGVRIENQFFDTYLFAKNLKEQQGWENVKLEYLSQVFSLPQPDAHRAWCDAEANVGVYFKLKKLGGY